MLSFLNNYLFGGVSEDSGKSTEVVEPNKTVVLGEPKLIILDELTIPVDLGELNTVKHDELNKTNDLGEPKTVEHDELNKTNVLGEPNPIELNKPIEPKELNKPIENDDPKTYESNEPNYVYELINCKRFTSETTLNRLFDKLWAEDSSLYMSTMFYIRNCRINSSEQNECNEVEEINVSLDQPIDMTIENTVEVDGLGEKRIAYYMALWILDNYEECFLENFTTMVKEYGYYKDCINVAMIALHKKYNTHKIKTILLPMVNALIEDENKIYSYMYESNTNTLALSEAVKWLPRKNKAYSGLIHYLNQMLCITGKKSDEEWRRYISFLNKFKYKSIEQLLSEKNHNAVRFNRIPKKALRMYGNKFIRSELKNKYVEFITMNKTEN